MDFPKTAQGYKYKRINEGIDVVAHRVIFTDHDLVVAFLPTLLFWNLQVPLQPKIALYSILALSYTNDAVGAIPMYQGYRLFFTICDVTGGE